MYACCRRFRGLIVRQFNRAPGAERLRGLHRQPGSFKFGERSIEN